MENNIQSKNEATLKQTGSPQKYAIFFVVILVFNLLININFFSLTKIYQEYLELSSKGYCQNKNFAASFMDDFGCFDPRVRGGAIIDGIRVVSIIIFSLIIWLLWRKSNNIYNQKKLLIIYTAGSIIIFLLSYSAIWLIFNRLYS